MTGIPRIDTLQTMMYRGAAHSSQQAFSERFSITSIKVAKHLQRLGFAWITAQLQFLGTRMSR